jgi:DNA repair exonuclease SbcCD ATPase subunit
MERIEEHTQPSPQVGEPLDGQAVESPALAQTVRADLPDGAQPGQADLSSAGNIDKIRDILFGVQMRDYEKRFTRLEERLIKESNSLRDDTKKRFDALELYLKQELESLTERLTSEQSARNESAEALSQGIKDTARAFEKRAAQMDEQSSRSQRELRQQILDQSKSLNDEIRQKYEELTAVLQREAEELRSDKTDRSALAALFTEVALRLNNDFKIPGAE